MPLLARFWTILFILFGMGISASSAWACSCARPNVKMTEDEYRAWTFEKAVNVVEGRITDVRAGDDIVREGRRVVIAKMTVKSVVKGEIPAGELKLMTMFGGGDCGVPMIFIGAVAVTFDIALEVRKVSEMPTEYMVDMCGYAGKAGDHRSARPKQ